MIDTHHVHFTVQARSRRHEGEPESECGEDGPEGVAGDHTPGAQGAPAQGGGGGGALVGSRPRIQGEGKVM